MNPPVMSGVPQGSVLGLILFLISISDINKAIHYSSVSSFADDSRFLKQISSTEDCNRLQKDLKTTSPTICVSTRECLKELDILFPTVP